MRPPKVLCKRYQVGTTEVQVFKNEQYRTGTNDTDHQNPSFPKRGIGPTLHQQTCGEVNHYREQKYKYIFRYKPHIEEAAGRQQHQPTPAMRQ